MSRFSYLRRPRYMCPHCGKVDGRLKDSLIREHIFEGKPCPGIGQVPRNPTTDHRPLWKDQVLS